MNNKRMINTTFTMVMLLSLSIDCLRNAGHNLIAVEESVQETVTQETEANTETAADTESP